MQTDEAAFIKGKTGREGWQRCGLRASAGRVRRGEAEREGERERVREGAFTSEWCRASYMMGSVVLRVERLHPAARVCMGVWSGREAGGLDWEWFWSWLVEAWFGRPRRRRIDVQ